MLKIILSSLLALGLVAVATITQLSRSADADGKRRMIALEDRLQAVESDVTSLRGERERIVEAVGELVRVQGGMRGDVASLGAKVEQGRAVASASRSRFGPTSDEEVDVVAEIKDIVGWLADLSRDVKKLERSSAIVNPNVENGWIWFQEGNSRYTLSGGKLTSAPVWGRSLYDPNAVNGGLNEGDVLIDIQPSTRSIRNVTFTPADVGATPVDVARMVVEDHLVVSEVESSGDDPRIVEIRMEMNVDDDDL